jgi:hypothetical protein
MEKSLKAIPTRRKYDYSAVKNALRQFVNADPREGATEEDFWKRVKHNGENVQEYAADLRALGEKAFKGPNAPSYDEAHHEKAILQRFISGLNNSHLERWIHLKSPSNLEDALTSALEYESFEKSKKKPKDGCNTFTAYASLPTEDIATVSAMNSGTSNEMSEMHTLMKQMAKDVHKMSENLDEFKRETRGKFGIIEAKQAELGRDISWLKTEMRNVKGRLDRLEIANSGQNNRGNGSNGGNGYRKENVGNSSFQSRGNGGQSSYRWDNSNGGYSSNYNKDQNRSQGMQNFQPQRFSQGGPNQQNASQTQVPQPSQAPLN